MAVGCLCSWLGATVVWCGMLDAGSLAGSSGGGRLLVRLQRLLCEAVIADLTGRKGTCARPELSDVRLLVLSKVRTTQVPIYALIHLCAGQQSEHVCACQHDSSSRH